MERSRISGAVAICALLVSAGSLLVSIRSCNQAKRSLELSTAEFEESRQFFWLAQTKNPSDPLVLALQPSNADVKIVEAYVTLPSSLVFADDLWSNGQQRLLQRDDGTYQFTVPQFQERLRTALEGNVTFKDGTFTLDNRPQEVPLAIECHYAVRGTLRTDRSLYGLKYEGVATMNPNQPPHYSVGELTLGPLIYNGEIGGGIRISDLIDRLWNEGGDHHVYVSPDGPVLVRTRQSLAP